MRDGNAVLEREQIALPVLAGDDNKAQLAEVEDLAKRAKSELGYAGLENKVSEAKKLLPDLALLRKFVDVLTELDMSPFSAESVAKYKKVALKDARKNRTKFWERNIYVIESVFNALLYVLLVSLAGCIMGPVIGSFWGVGGAVFAVCVKTCILMIVAIVGLAVLFGDINDLEWQKAAIANYQGEIPEFVLRKAIQIKQGVPGVEFFVEHIGKKEDPFLLARYQGKEYYIEVWDEPKFESQLLQ